MAADPHSSVIYLVRHGETAWSRSGRHTGRTDVPLTDRGRDEARGLAPLVKSVDFALVLSSPLLRATETARLAGLGTGLRLCPDLQEWDYGDYEGLTLQEIRRRVPGWTVWTEPCPNGESAARVGERADHALALAEAAQGPVALVAHGHILRVVAARWVGLEPIGGRLLRLDTASVSRLGYEHEDRVVLSWNERPADLAP